MLLFQLGHLMDVIIPIRTFDECYSFQLGHLMDVIIPIRTLMDNCFLYIKKLIIIYNYKVRRINE